ncbi:MAG: dihydrofolate reductase family protein [Anaerolineaceae bacterium]|nr:dihydrofolate reductase family protein [Anaerolineaceae bacterium]
MHPILRLYPQPSVELPLVGAYLAHDVRQYPAATGKPFVYANFVASIDGRIAIPRQSGGGMMVPKATANERDWRLYQELASQADIILSSGRYLREWAEGRAQEMLQVDDPRFADLREWRKERGLPPQADIAVISASLDFPIPPALMSAGRRVVVVTTEHPDAARVREIEDQGAQVLIAGKKSVDGSLLLKRLSELGYRSVYSAAGPKVLHLLVSGDVLDRLYLTYANRMLGGQPYSSILEGALLTPPVDLKIHQIYLDAQGLGGLGQMFVSYDCRL